MVMNFLHFVLSEEKLTISAIVTVKSVALQDVNYDNLIKDFVGKKFRRKRVKISLILYDYLCTLFL